MKLETLHETISQKAADYISLIKEYLLENVLRVTIDRSGVGGLNVTKKDVKGDSSLTSVVVNDEGIITLTHYSRVPRREVPMERVSIFDPDSLPKVLEFVNRFPYE